MPRINQLPSLTTADNADEIAIVDVSASTTKKITRGDLLRAPLPNNSVTTAAVANNAITAPKIDFTTFGWLFVRRTSTQSIPNSTTTNIIFNNVTEADGSAYNSTTGVYTAPSSGIYVLAARVTFQESVGISLRVAVNGNTYVSEDTPATGMYMTKSIGVSLRLSAGDTVAVSVHQVSGSPRTIHNDGNTTNLTITRLA